MSFPIVRSTDRRTLLMGDRRGNTVASAVIDRAGLNGAQSAKFVLGVGTSMLGATSGMVLRTFEHDTVSATASGMTAITSGNTSGITMTTSGDIIALIVDLRNKARFLGVTLSVPTTSALCSVDMELGDMSEVPAPIASDGFVSVRNIGQ